MGLGEFGTKSTRNFFCKQATRRRIVIIIIIIIIVRDDGKCGGVCVMMGASACLPPCSASMHAHARAIAATSGAALESLSTPAESSKRLVWYQNFRNCPYPSLPALVKKKKH
jgi:hypothetical protein